jgi:prepilin peptidase CpaA
MMSGTPASLPALLVLAVVLTIAVYTEIKNNRIPNWLTLCGMASGVLIGFLSGTSAFWSSIGGLAMGFGFLFIFYVFGGVGGGDVKLMGAVGALMGSDLIKPTLFYTAMIGAFLAAIIVVWRKDFWSRLVAGARRVAFWRKPVEGDISPCAPITIPYALAIASGCLVTLLVKAMA